MSADITALLQAHGQGQADALDRLVPLVYNDLRRLARAKLRQVGQAQSLDTTGLVHEAYLKLVDQSRANWNDRGHFFAVSATAMRQILVDHARHRQRVKRGGGAAATALDEARHGVDTDVERLLQIDLALQQLAREDERLVRVFECRYFGGYSEQETAQALGMSLRTVQRDWLKARAWLRRALGQGGQTEPTGPGT
jgi:RNA polymerase sigma factor (TIGR02999 family)